MNHKMVIFGLFLFFAGAYLLYNAIGWGGVLGVFLWQWSDNISQRSIMEQQKK